MNKLLILLLLLCSLNSFGQHGKRVTNQRLLQPNTSFIQYPVIAGSKGVYSYAGCGTPDTAVSIPENAQLLTTTYLDTCSGTTWQYNPSNGGYWDTLSRGSGNIINYYAQGNGSFTDTVATPTYGDKLEIKIYTPGRTISGLSTATTNGSGFSNKWYSDGDTLHIFYSFGPIDTVFYILSGYIVDTAVLIPPTPTGMVQDAHDILWSWGSVPHATGYYAEYAYGSSHDYTFLVETTDTTYLHSGIPPDTQVKFRVRAEGDSVWYGSNFGYASARTDTLVTIATPSITVTTTGATTITANWSASPHAVGYKLLYSTDGDNFSLLDSVGAGTTAYVFDSLSTNTRIWFKVQAQGDGDVYSNSEYSDTASAITAMLPQLATPNLIIDSTTTNAGYMHWSAIAGAVNYLILYRTATTDWQLAGQTTSDTLFFVHNNLTANTEFYWELQAIADNTTHSNSNFDIDSAATKSAALQPLATPIPSATPVSPNRINISYQNVANEIAYVFEISKDSAAWIVVDTLNANITTSFATNLKANTFYFLRVKAIAGTGTGYQNSAYGFTKAKTLNLTVLAANTITATTTGTNSIRVNVTSNAHASGYQIEYSSDGGLTYTIADTITTLVYNHQELNEKTTYKYRDKVLGDSITYDNSVYSNIATATTDSTVIVAQTLAAPTGLNVVANSTTQITATWNPVTSASYYQVERSTNKTTWTASPQVAAGTTTLAITSLTPATKYYVRLFAGGNGTTTLNSPYSAIDSVTTNSPITLATPNLTAANIDATDNRLNWTASANASFYTLRYSLNKTSWTNISTANVLTFLHQTLNPQTKYYYQIQANTNNPSVYANSGFDLDSATTPALPPTPLNTPNVVLSVASFSRLDGSWGAIANAAGYKVDKSSNGSTWANVANLAANVTTYSLTGLQPATTYWLRVQATATGTVYSNSDYGIASATTTDTSTTTPLIVHGVMLGGSTSAKITGAQNLGVTTIRSSYDGNTPNYPNFNNQFKVLWNYEPNTPGDGLPLPTDSGQFACTMDSMFVENGTKNIIGIVVINEPNNVGYWTDNISAANYLRLLQACVNVGKRYKIPVYDGGWTGPISRYMVWWDYMQRGFTDSAASYQALAFPNGTNLNNWRTSSNYASRIKYMDTIVANLKNVATDAVNVHWYETVRDEDAASTSAVSEEAFIETCRFYSRIAQKPVITNEYGLNNTSNTAVQTGFIKALKAAHIKIALYYGVGSLTNTDGSLTPLGANYKNQITQ